MKRQKLKRKNNPVDNIYISLLSNAIIFGSQLDLIDVINYYKQGEICEDCDQDFSHCQCEFCEDCFSRRCMCDIGSLTKNKVRKITWELAKLTLNKNDLQKLVSSIPPSTLEYITEKLDDITIPKIDKNWLKLR